MEVTPKEVEVYVMEDGKVPFSEWLNSLKDFGGAARILLRIDRIRLGNLGDYKTLADGVCELRIDSGPGYRVYFSQIDSQRVLILCGGDKSSQKRDIRNAQKYWADYRSQSDA